MGQNISLAKRIEEKLVAYAEIKKFPKNGGVWRVFPKGNYSGEVIEDAISQARYLNTQEENNAITKKYYFDYDSRLGAWLIRNECDVSLIWDKVNNTPVLWITPELLDKFSFRIWIDYTKKWVRVFKIKFLDGGAIELCDERNTLLTNEIDVERLCRHSGNFLRKPKEQPADEKTYPMPWVQLAYGFNVAGLLVEIHLRGREIKLVHPSGLTARAKCGPRDKFDLQYGVELATARLEEKVARAKIQSKLAQSKPHDKHSEASITANPPDSLYNPRVNVQTQAQKLVRNRL